MIPVNAPVPDVVTDGPAVPVPSPAKPAASLPAGGVPAVSPGVAAATPVPVQVTDALGRVLTVPGLLLEGDPVAVQPFAGPGRRFATPVQPLPATGPGLPDADSPELEEDYGTGRLWLAARDPHTLYASWDLSPGQAAAAGTELSLRIYRGESPVGGFRQVAVPVGSRSVFIPAEGAGMTCCAEIGFVDAAGDWVVLAASAPTRTPVLVSPEMPEVRFLTVAPPPEPPAAAAGPAEARAWSEAPAPSSASEVGVAPPALPPSPTQSPKAADLGAAVAAPEAEAGAVATPAAAFASAAAGPAPLPSPGAAGVAAPGLPPGPELDPRPAPDAPPPVPSAQAGSSDATVRLDPEPAWDAAERAVGQGIPRAEQVAGPEAAPTAPDVIVTRGGVTAVSAAAEPSWTSEQAAAMAEEIARFDDLVAGPGGPSSGEFAGVAPRERRAAKPGRPGGLRLPSSLEVGGVGEAGRGGPLRGAGGARRGFWFNLNAELIVYGATEPDAQVRIEGEPVTLRPDGTFTLRFALPDGDYTLRAEATAADGTETRGARLRFVRRTAYRGQVEQHPTPAGLEPPPPGGAG